MRKGTATLLSLSLFTRNLEIKAPEQVVSIMSIHPIWMTINKCLGVLLSLIQGSKTNFNKGKGVVYVNLIMSRGNNYGV